MGLRIHTVVTRARWASPRGSVGRTPAAPYSRRRQNSGRALNRLRQTAEAALLRLHCMSSSMVDTTRINVPVPDLKCRTTCLTSWVFLLPTLTIMTSMQSILIEFAKYNSNGIIPFHTPSAVFYTELIKFVVAGAVWLWQRPTLPYTGLEDFTLYQAALHSIPAGMFVVQNNMMYYILKVAGASTFQMWSCSKIIISGLLARVLLKQLLTPIQWTALFLLAIGLSMSKRSNCEGTEERSEWFGVMLTLLNCLLSAMSNVRIVPFARSPLHSRPCQPLANTSVISCM